MRWPWPTTVQTRWIHAVKWIIVALFALRLLQLFVSWLTSAG